jgi:hypothetical protein
LHRPWSVFTDLGRFLVGFVDFLPSLVGFDPFLGAVKSDLGRFSVIWSVLESDLAHLTFSSMPPIFYIFFWSVSQVSQILWSVFQVVGFPACPNLWSVYQWSVFQAAKFLFSRPPPPPPLPVHPTPAPLHSTSPLHYGVQPGGL